MYSRQISDKPEKIIQNKRANFGTFFGVTPLLDVKGMRAPYAGIPLPSVISNLRIKSRLDFVFSCERYIGMAHYYDFKAFGLSEIIFWNRESAKKTVYHAFIPPRRRLIPLVTQRGICASYSRRRFIKVSWGRMHQHHALTFKVKGDNVRPDAEGYYYSPIKDDFHNDMLFVTPWPTSSRCSADWLSTMTVQGHLTIGGESVEDSAGLAMMSASRSYFKFHSKNIQVYGIGQTGGQKIAFQLVTSTMESSDADRNNQNALFCGNEITPLPSVYITHPFGIEKKWVIQDTESMIDLTFTPSSVNTRKLNVIAMRTTYSIIYGTFDGVLLTKEGRKIPLKGFPGIIYSDLLRL